MEDAQTISVTLATSSLTKGQSTFAEGKIASLTKGAGKTGHPHDEE